MPKPGSAFANLRARRTSPRNDQTRIEAVHDPDELTDGLDASNDPEDEVTPEPEVEPTMTEDDTLDDDEEIEDPRKTRKSRRSSRIAETKASRSPTLGVTISRR